MNGINELGGKNKVEFSVNDKILVGGNGVCRGVKNGPERWKSGEEGGWVGEVSGELLETGTFSVFVFVRWSDPLLGSGKPRTEMPDKVVFAL